MGTPAEAEYKKVVKKDYLIWPEPGLSGEDKAELETKIRSVLDERYSGKGN